jgi:RimJ/RimL family protein N-acetyltransferase
MAVVQSQVHPLHPAGSVTIRHATPDDTARVLHCAREMMNSSPYVLTAIGEFSMTLDEERTFITNIFEHPRQLFLIAEVVGKEHAEDGIVGMCVLTQNTAKRKLRHTVTLGMGMRSSHRGVRVGTALMTEAVRWGVAHPDLHVMLLGVYAANEPGLKLYRAHGFTEYGRLPKGCIEDDGTMSEQIEMVRWLKA